MNDGKFFMYTKLQAKESTTVSSKQQNAVSAALAAGVPAGQQRRYCMTQISSFCLLCPSWNMKYAAFLAWRTLRPNERWWSSALPPTMTTDGSTSARWEKPLDFSWNYANNFLTGARSDGPRRSPVCQSAQTSLPPPFLPQVNMTFLVKLQIWFF